MISSAFLNSCRDGDEHAVVEPPRGLDRRLLLGQLLQVEHLDRRDV